MFYFDEKITPPTRQPQPQSSSRLVCKFHGRRFRARFTKGRATLEFMGFARRIIVLALASTWTSLTVVTSFGLLPVRYNFSSRLKHQAHPMARFLQPARSSSRQRRHLYELTCGLQILVRIRGKRSREEDYTNQIFSFRCAHVLRPLFFPREAYDEYAKRLRPVLTLDTIWHKTDEDLEAAVNKDAGVVVCLDEGGHQMDSAAFSKFLFSKLEEGGSRLTFVVGGAEGLPPGLKEGSQDGRHLSLSSMTLTHLWARALLAEQIYRASEIRRGSRYHKE